MTFILIVLGAIAGAAIAEFEGTVFGAILGYIISIQISIQNRLADLEKHSPLEFSTSKSKEEHTEVKVQEKPKVTPAKESTAPTSSPEKKEAAKVITPTASITPKQKEVVSDVEQETTPVISSKPNPVVAFFTGGNTAVRVGVVILFVGIAFLMKYAIDHNKMPIEYRLISTALGALVMLVIGWRLREKRPGYALTMQGGAIAIIYLTVFAAFRMYHLIPPTAAFAMLAVVAVSSATLAILQNSLALAVVGVAGGFLAPILTSTGAGNHVYLFSYYSILNIGILSIAWFKSWRILNLTGFAFTFGIGAIWGYRAYAPEHFTTTEPFLLFFIVLYIAIAILFATRQAPSLKGPVDGTLIFGVPIIGMGLQSQLVAHFEYGLAWSALGFGIFYILMATVLFRKHRQNMRALTESFLAMGVVFGTLVIPLAFDGRWTSAAWAFEGAAMIWIGLRQNRFIIRCFGALLLFGSSVAFMIDFNAGVGPWPVLNSLYIGCLIITLSAFISSNLFRLHADKLKNDEEVLIPILLILGLIWWFVGGLNEINDHVTNIYKANSVMFFVVFSSLVFVLASKKLQWPQLGYIAASIIPVMIFTALYQWVELAHPMMNGGIIVWPLSFIILYGLLRLLDKDLPEESSKWGHATSFWLLNLLLAWQAYWGVGQAIAQPTIWSHVTWALVPSVLIYFVTHRSGSEKNWPIGALSRFYLGAGVLPVMALLWGGAIFINLSNTGDAWPLPYIPLFNPLDITQMIVFIVGFSWFVRVKKLEFAITWPENLNKVYGLVTITVFIWMNAVLLRTMHHWVGIDFSFDAMYSSVLVQASLSIFWGLLGLGSMVLAARLKTRIVWIAGAIMLAVVVIKLFIVDLSNTGTIERIISFIVVGVLLLVVGYLSPVPPARLEKMESVES